MRPEGPEAISRDRKVVVARRSTTEARKGRHIIKMICRAFGAQIYKQSVPTGSRPRLLTVGPSGLTVVSNDLDILHHPFTLSPLLPLAPSPLNIESPVEL
jgi:hypothetical protein